MVVLLSKSFSADLSVSEKNVEKFTYHPCHKCTEFVFRALTLSVINFLYLFSIKYIPLSPYDCHTYSFQIENVFLRFLLWPWYMGANVIGSRWQPVSPLFYIFLFSVTLPSSLPSPPFHPLCLPFHSPTSTASLLLSLLFSMFFSPFWLFSWYNFLPFCSSFSLPLFFFSSLFWFPKVT